MHCDRDRERGRVIDLTKRTAFARELMDRQKRDWGWIAGLLVLESESANRKWSREKRKDTCNCDIKESAGEMRMNE